MHNIRVDHSSVAQLIRDPDALRESLSSGSKNFQTFLDSVHHLRHTCVRIGQLSTMFHARKYMYKFTCFRHRRRLYSALYYLYRTASRHLGRNGAVVALMCSRIQLKSFFQSSWLSAGPQARYPWHCVWCEQGSPPSCFRWQHGPTQHAHFHRQD